ncbi:MAG: hypothetical protein FJ147_00090 [Deltaproteobacteria bacterium]|nr:hypothetical protein [Deltaproteobacteria bacterium]
MKKSLVCFCLVLTACVLFPARGWTGGMHFGGGHSSGHFGGGQSFGGHQHFGGGRYGNFGSPGPFTNYGSPAFRSPGFGRSPYCPSPPRFGSSSSFRQGIPFFSPGFSSRRFVYRQRLSPAGPPPIGAPGSTPSLSTAPTRAPTYFYCTSHGFRYTDQQAFFEHLNFAHYVPLQRAAEYCQRVENGLIFSHD